MDYPGFYRHPYVLTGDGRPTTDVTDRACERLGRLGPAAAFLCGLTFGACLALGVGLIALTARSLTSSDAKDAGPDPLPVTVEGPPSLLKWLTFASTLVALGIAVFAVLSDRRHAKQARQDLADHQADARREAIRQQLSYEVRGLVLRLEDEVSRMNSARTTGPAVTAFDRDDPRLLRDLGTSITRARPYDHYLYRGLVGLLADYWSAKKAARELHSDGGSTERGRSAVITLYRAGMNINTWSRALESRLLDVEADPEMANGEAALAKPSLGWPEEDDLIAY